MTTPGGTGGTSSLRNRGGKMAMGLIAFGTVMAVIMVGADVNAVVTGSRSLEPSRLVVALAFGGVFVGIGVALLMSERGVGRVVTSNADLLTSGERIEGTVLRCQVNDVFVLPAEDGAGTDGTSELLTTCLVDLGDGPRVVTAQQEVPTARLASIVPGTTVPLRIDARPPTLVAIDAVELGRREPHPVGRTSELLLPMRGGTVAGRPVPFVAERRATATVRELRDQGVLIDSYAPVSGPGPGPPPALDHLLTSRGPLPLVVSTWETPARVLLIGLEVDLGDGNRPFLARIAAAVPAHRVGELRVRQQVEVLLDPADPLHRIWFPWLGVDDSASR